MTTNPTSTRTTAAIEGRRADTTRRRERVDAAIFQALKSGQEISVAAIAHAAGVDRTFFYRHRDLLAKVHAAQARTPHDHTRGAKACRESLHADLLAAHERSTRLAAHVQQLERRLSQALGEQAWRQSGLGAPPDLDELQQRLVDLEQQAVDLRVQLEEREQDLTAARAANRELMTRINIPHTTTTSS
jgi:hypothetical protein